MIVLSNINCTSTSSGEPFPQTYAHPVQCFRCYSSDEKSVAITQTRAICVQLSWWTDMQCLHGGVNKHQFSAYWDPAVENVSDCDVPKFSSSEESKVLTAIVRLTVSGCKSDWKECLTNRKAALFRTNDELSNDRIWQVCTMNNIEINLSTRVAAHLLSKCVKALSYSRHAETADVSPIYCHTWKS